LGGGSFGGLVNFLSVWAVVVGRGNFGGTWIGSFFFSVCGQVFVGREVLLDLVKFCWVWSSFVRYGQVHCTTNPKHFMDDFIPFQTTF
jgi:hypothetical protein